MYIIPNAIIAGYGRTMTIQYKCLDCGYEFFPDNKFDPFCSMCIDKKRRKKIYKQDSVFYINIIDYVQKVQMSFTKRNKIGKKKLLKKYDYTCQYCAYSPKYCFDFIPLHIDHIIPRSYGGSDKTHNLTVACEWCNSHLSNKTFDSFIDKKIYIAEIRKKMKLPYTEQQWHKLAMKAD